MKIKKTCNKRVKRFSPRQLQIIDDIAESISLLMPATSRGSFCLEKILKKERLIKFFDKKLPNKHSQIKKFIIQVYSKYPRKFKKIINNSLADSIKWRQLKGNPVLKAEIDKFSENLYLLNIDLRKEINDLKLPTERPKISPPPIYIKQSLEKFGLNPLLLKEVLPLFSDGYLNEAVRKSGEIFETEIRKYSKKNRMFGRNLVSTVFNVQHPLIDISGYHKSDVLDPIDEKEGYFYLSMSAMHWCKNIMSHADIDQLSPNDAVTRILLISHLIDIFKKCVVQSSRY